MIIYTGQIYLAILPPTHYKYNIDISRADGISLKIFFVLVACCASVMISASGPAKNTTLRFYNGQYDSHKMGSNARTIYRDPRENYLFYSETGKWLVS